MKDKQPEMAVMTKLNQQSCTESCVVCCKVQYEAKIAGRRIISPEIEPSLKQPTLSLNEEGRNEITDMVKVSSCFRGSYLWHVVDGLHGNKGEPAVSAGSG
jgi:hypothetical protein